MLKFKGTVWQDTLPAHLVGRVNVATSVSVGMTQICNTTLLLERNEALGTKKTLVQYERNYFSHCDCSDFLGLLIKVMVSPKTSVVPAGRNPCRM